MKRFLNKTIILIFCSFILLYFAGIFGVQFLITQGYTNVESAEIVLPNVPENILTGEIVDISNLKLPISSRIPKALTEVYSYLEAYPDDKEEVEQAYFYLNPDGDNPNRRPSGHDGLNFIVEGLDTRKEWLKALKVYSIVLDVDPDLVYACVLGEQIRIASQPLREIVKEMIRLWTPTLFRSDYVSLGIAGIKLYTATLIRKDAIKYSYGADLQDDQITEQSLEYDDDFNAKYATYLVKTILTRREQADIDISNNPGVVCTLYNMGNHPNKQPHANPKIGGSVIWIDDHKYVYGGISLAMYRYLKIYH